MKIATLLIAAVLILTIGACDGILDLKDLDAVSEADVWNDAALAEAYGNRIYMDNLPRWPTGDENDLYQDDDEEDREGHYVSSLSDESPGGGGTMYGQLSEGSSDHWPYEFIRRINVLLAEVDEGTISDGLKERLKGEAFFFRAWRYWEMVKRYGGVPLILEPQELQDDLLVERAPTSVVMNQILSDLDESIARLPEFDASSSANDGHLHVGTALAVKGRILLYYASPQFNRSGDIGRWQEAYDANLEAKQYLDAHGFGLYPDFAGFWFDGMNREVIFGRTYSHPVSFHHWAAETRPLDMSQGATGGNWPTLEMVNSFPMADGRPIDAHPEYDPVYFWQNRDPRFQATVAYNGAAWELSGESGRRQWTYVGGESNNPTQTGFYTRKAVNPDEDSFEAFEGDTQWIEIRYAEVLLNLAEAANRVGQTQLAYDLLIALRERAGIEQGGGLYGLEPGMSSEEMQDAIMLERKIELAYEGKRHWDLRRNMLFEDLLNGTRRHGLRINLTVPESEWEAARETVDLQSEYHQYFAHHIVELDTQFEINWQPNYYFYAIPQGHLRLNSRLEQTEGWAGGTFDPLQ